MEGLIIKNISNDYTVKSNNNIYICKARGKFKKDKIIPQVGDKVTFDEKKNYILKIHKRKNTLVRPSVANIDQALVVTSTKSPDLDTNLLDKLLTIISYNNIEPVICFTKLDLLSIEENKVCKIVFIVLIIVVVIFELFSIYPPNLLRIELLIKQGLLLI